MLIHRRSLLLGMGSLLASPAIVKATSIMPVKTMIWDGRVPVTIFNHGVNAGLGSYLTHARQIVGDVPWGEGRGRGIKYWQIWDPYCKSCRYGIHTARAIVPSHLVDCFHLKATYLPSWWILVRILRRVYLLLVHRREVGLTWDRVRLGTA